jgi:precorrin-2 dehydrogenase/sirohydrochlorin ferrochelatase
MPQNLFPIFVKIAGRQCLVVGAGSMAADKISLLLDSGARVRVLAPSANPRVKELSAAGKIEWTQRDFSPDDLANTFLVIAATSDYAVNRAVFLEAQSRGILCNSVDDPPHCDFYFPAVVRRGDLQIAISTAGESPALAQRLRQELETCLDESAGDWVHLVGALRREILAAHPPSEERKKLLHLLAHTTARELASLSALDPLTKFAEHADAFGASAGAKP